MIQAFKTTTPQLAERVYIAASAVVIGDVTIGADSSIWPQAVVRGDVNSITIGSRTNIQDGSVLHVNHENRFDHDGSKVHIGNDVTVGHRVILHGCRIEDRCLIGMGSIILDDALLQPEVFLAAGSLVPSGKELISGYLWMGNPVRKIRPLSKDEIEFLHYSAKHYMHLKNEYL